jgi:hypothetical protein
MKRILSILSVIVIAFSLISWGVIGHRTIALIAEQNLTPQAKAAVADLLDGQSMADVSCWADNVQKLRQYRHTAAWHFFYVNRNLDRKSFEKDVKSQSQDNLYRAIKQQKDILLSPATSKEQKSTALKFLINLVADAHQPMHVAGAEDKGGKRIKVHFENKNTNLHALWDSSLIEHGGYSDGELARRNSHYTGDMQIWQNDSPMHWLWESYQISDEQYKFVHNGYRTDSKYYPYYMPVLEKRLQKAAIRLAGLLNDIFNQPSPQTAQLQSTTQDKDNIYRSIQLEDIANHIGENVSVQGRVYSARSIDNFDLLNMGAEYPYQMLEVVLRDKTVGSGKDFVERSVRIKGRVSEHEGRPRIEITDKKLIRIYTFEY